MDTGLSLQRPDCCISAQMAESAPPTRRRGPIKDRSCTDVICCMLFAIFVVASAAVGVFAYVMGDPRQLLYPVDYVGNFCGTEKLSDRPYLFYFDPTACVRVGVSAIFGCPTPAICVAECPSKYFTFVTGPSRDAICKYHLNASAVSLPQLADLVRREDCAAYYFKSAPVASRCFPSVVTDVTTVVNKNNETLLKDQLIRGFDYLTEFLDLQMIGIKLYEDFAKSWPIVLVFFGLAAVLTYLLIFLMRWIAAPIVIGCILLFVGFFSFAVYYCFTKYFELKETNPSGSNFTWSTDPDYYLGLYQTWLALGIIAAIFLGLTLLIVLVLRRRLLIAFALLKEASRAIACMLFTLLWPVIPLILQLVVFAYWCASTLFLASTGKASFSQFLNDSGIAVQIPCDPNENSTAGSICSFVHYGDDMKYAIVLQVFQLFMWLWLVNFIIGLGQMTLAGSFASYYWAFNKKHDIPSFPVSSALARSLRYHLGSIAFGALLLAIVQLIRIFLEFLDRRLKGAENRLAKFLVKCLKCCFWCLEKFIKFINRNAYILIAVSGKNFCTSAKNAFSLILRNCLRAAVLDGVTDFLIFMCKLFIIGGIGVLSFFFFTGELANAIPYSEFSEFLRRFQPKLNYYLTPVIIIIIGTFIIATVFFNVYSMAVDTMFLCFLEDLEENDGSVEKPFYMSKELLKILGKKNDKYKEIKSKLTPRSSVGPEPSSSDNISPNGKTKKQTKV